MRSGTPIHIVFCVDDNFCFPLAVLIASLLEHTNRPCELHILTAGLEREHIARLMANQTDKVNIRLYPIRDDLLDNANISDGFSQRLSIATYYRFLICRTLPRHIERVLFLDADMLVRGDLSALYDMDLEGAVSAVVRDEKLTDEQRWEALALSSAHYFNAGLMLMDMNKWRSEHIAEHCFTVSKTRHNLDYNDQDVLNIVLDGKVKYLSAKWNRQTHNLGNDAKDDTAIVHFTGAEKPWHASCLHLFCDEYRACIARSTYHDQPLVNYLDSFDRSVIAKVGQYSAEPLQILIYGCGQRGRRLFHHFSANEQKVRVVGFIDRSSLQDYQGLPVYTSWQEQPVDAVVIGSEAYYDEIQQRLQGCGLDPSRVI